MKKLYKLCFSLLVAGSFSSSAMAQGDQPYAIGTSKSMLNQLQQANGANLRTSSSTLDLQVSGSRTLSAKVNFKKSGTNNEFLNGEIENVPGSSFYLKATDKTVEGHIILKKTKEAFKYSSDAKGNAFVSKVDINKLICIDYENAPNAAQATSPAVSAPIGQAVLNLQSLPGAPGCVLLDVDGYNMPAGNYWNNGNAINAASSGLSDADVQEFWEVVSEDYRPFNLNVTTSEAVFNSYPRNRRMRCVVTPTNTAAPGAGGVAYIGSFNWDNDVPCWVFVLAGKMGGDAASHEIGHTFGLSHDGRELPSGHEEYFVGLDGSGSVWAPIMGAGYYKSVAQWSRGEYQYANNQEDDVAKIADAQWGVGYRGDDYGNGTGNAATLTYNSSGAVDQKNGLISSEADWDFFSFTTGGGNVTLNVNTVWRDGDLDVIVRLYNSSGTQIGSYTNDGLGQLNATLNANLGAGKYYISVDGTGSGNPSTGGYSAYGSIGSYSITGTIPPGSVQGVVIAYKDCNFSGSAGGLDVGDYTLSQLNARGILNDDVSSLKIAAGYQVTLYQDDNFTGSTLTLTADNSCLVSNGWNDLASSIKVRALNSGTLIQAENYSAMLGVQTESTTDAGGGLNVGWIDAGDWMVYPNINFPSSGTYKVEYRVASLNGGQLSLDLNAGSIQLGSLNVPATGGWQNWTTISHNVTVNAGTYNLGLFAQVGGWNVNWIRITPNGAAKMASAATVDVPSNVNLSTIDPVSLYPNPVEGELVITSDYSLSGASIKIINTSGMEVYNSNSSSSIDVSALDSGIYTLLITTENNQKFTKRFIKR